MIIVKATTDSEAGVIPPEHLFELEDFGASEAIDRFHKIGVGGVERQP
jgi:hypothetical protein